MSKNKIDEHILYPMLFSRLTWPSLLVQERAADAIASLLIDKRYEPTILNLLMEWIASQKLESVAIKGILILLKAKMLEPTFQGPSLDDILGIYQNRSMLSWLLFSAYDPQYADPISKSLVHSGAAPQNYPTDPFFEKHVTRFLPPIYDYWAKFLERKGYFPFRKQWAYEWKSIINKNQITPSSISLNHFWGVKRMGRRFTAIDTIMSDVYRSAFLRTLAYGLDAGHINESHALFLTAATCPIDLELWKIPPQKRPSWWPCPVTVSQKTETAIGAIWNQVEKLWVEQSNLFKCEGENWVIGEATGFIQQDDTIYDLDIYGVFQKCHGPEEPEYEEIINFISGEESYDAEKNVISFNPPSLLHFKGEIESTDVNSLVRKFGDWTILPAFSFAHPTTTPRWQSWRMYRNIWLPTSVLGDQGISFAAENNSLLVKDKDTNGVIGKWNDWVDGLSEMVIDEAPLQSGQFLLLSAKRVKEFSQVTNSSFCWFCRLNIYYRDERSLEDFKVMRDYRAYGNTRLIK